MNTLAQAVREASTEFEYLFNVVGGLETPSIILNPLLPLSARRLRRNASQLQVILYITEKFVSHPVMGNETRSGCVLGRFPAGPGGPEGPPIEPPVAGTTSVWAKMSDAQQPLEAPPARPVQLVTAAIGAASPSVWIRNCHQRARSRLYDSNKLRLS